MKWVLELTHPSLFFTNISWSVSFITSSVFQIILSFILLGICASDYLCPNVTNIVELKQRPPMRNRSGTTSSNMIKISSNASSGAIMAILLSWCNSSPDLFSNFISWTSTTSSNLTTISLSVGEVLGACGIILCIVQGTIIFIMSSIDLNLTKNQKFNIWRDLIMVLVAMLTMTYIVLQNRISLMNCLFMIFVYSFYIYLKFAKSIYRYSHSNDSISATTSTNQVKHVSSHDNSFHSHDNENNEIIDGNMNSAQVGNSSQMVNNYLDLEGNDNDLNNNPLSYYDLDEEEDNTELRTGIKQSLISAMDFNNLLNILENSSSSTTNLTNLGHEMINIDNMSDILRNQDNLTLHEETNRAMSEPIFYHPGNELALPDDDPARYAPNSAPITFDPYHDDPNALQTDLNDMEPESRWKYHLQKNKKYGTLICKILTPHLLNFKTKSKVDATLSILTTPFVLILQLSCPRLIDILEYDDYTTYYSLPIIKSVILWMQALVTPLMTMTLIACLCSWERIHLLVWIITASVVIGLILLLAHFHRSVIVHNRFSLLKMNTSLEEIELKNKERRELERLQTLLNMIFLSMGILNSILFISLIANILIELMELYQVLTGISKAILGLTIFAWGNSLSDLLSNMAMCRLYLKVPNKDHIEMVATKFFVIAFQSCLGGVMLNSMIGIGLSGLITMNWVYSNQTDWWFLRYIELQDGAPVKNRGLAGCNYQFTVSCSIILLQTIILLNLINGVKLYDKLSKKQLKWVGVGMCALWGVATLINVCLEVFN